jgi:hypothetical protein
MVDAGEVVLKRLGEQVVKQSTNTNPAYLAGFELGYMKGLLVTLYDTMPNVREYLNRRIEVMDKLNG